jgi:hypothetical protein
MPEQRWNVHQAPTPYLARLDHGLADQLIEFCSAQADRVARFLDGAGQTLREWDFRYRRIWAPLDRLRLERFSQMVAGHGVLSNRGCDANEICSP